jgi:pimeloyl-ACP methyl ester carboxylesterase
VLAWDAPGYGGSKPLPDESPSAEAYAQALGRWLDALGIDKAVIGTNSWGTPTAVVFARLHPERVRALVLGGPAAGYGSLPKEEREKRTEARLARVRALGMKKMREEDASDLVAPGTRAEVIGWITSAEGLHAGGLCAGRAHARRGGRAARDRFREMPDPHRLGRKGHAHAARGECEAHRRGRGARDAADGARLRPPAAPRVPGGVQRRGAGDREVGLAAGVGRAPV